MHLTVHVLSNGQRIIEQESMIAFLIALEGGTDLTPEDAERFAVFLRIARLAGEGRG